MVCQKDLVMVKMATECRASTGGMNVAHGILNQDGGLEIL